jgi:hypothetical protein
MARIWLIRCAVTLSVALLSGCAAGIPEFEQYRVAFAEQYDVGARALDRTAAAERAVAERMRARETGIAAFDPSRARYYLDIGDPPLTGAIRDSLDAVRAYNDTLSALASGEAAAVAAARARATGVAVARAAGATAAVAAPASAAFVPAAEAALAALLPIAERLAAWEDVTAFRALLLEAYPDMRALMVALRDDATPEMFEMIKRSYVAPGSLGGVDGVPRDRLADLEADRRLLAAWVVLLDETVLAMDAAIAAVEGGGGAAALSAAAAEVQALAAAVDAALRR